MPAKLKPDSFTVAGITVHRTRRAGNARTKGKAQALRTSDKRTIVYEMTIRNFSQADIAAALGCSQPYITKLLQAEIGLRQPKWIAAADSWRFLAVEQSDSMISVHAPRARAGDPDASSMMLRWSERKDRLLGLYTHRLELSDANGGAIRPAPPYNLSLLTDVELEAYEWMTRKINGLTVEPASISFTALQPETVPALEHQPEEPSTTTDQPSTMQAVNPP